MATNQTSARGVQSAAQAASAIPKAALRGMASGVFFMAFFGTLWGSIGVGGVAGWAAPWPTVLVVLIGVALLVGAVALWRGSGRLRDAATWEQDNTDRWFVLIVALEGVAIAIASVVCNATGHFALFFPIMALIVGIHFFPLARLFQAGTHYLTGALLCVVGLVALLVVPVTATLGGREIMARWLVVGAGCAVILWGTGLLLLVQGWRALRGAAVA